jgi:hypothetical protein
MSNSTQKPGIKDKIPSLNLDQDQKTEGTRGNASEGGRFKTQRREPGGSGSSEANETPVHCVIVSPQTGHSNSRLS